MRHSTVKTLKIAVIGGGSTYSPELIDGLIARAAELGLDEVALHDIDASRLHIVGSFCGRMLKAAGAPFGLTLTQDLDTALDGAGMVFTQIRVGGQRARILDEKTGMRFGLIGQETTGVGGFAKALRTIPQMLAICRRVEAVAPRAWMVNFTNPSGMVTEAILRHSVVRCVGLCNIPVNLHLDVAKFIGVPPEKVTLDYVGLNHLAWVRRVLVGGRDVAAPLFAQNIKGMQPKNIPDMDYPEALLSALRMFPGYYNRYYYMAATAGAQQRRKRHTRGEEVLAIENRLLEMYCDPRLHTKPAMLGKRGGAYYSKAAIDVASAIVNDARNVQIVNVLNAGAIDDFYRDASVEIPCVVGRGGARPIRIGALEPHLLGMMHVVKAYERIAIEAAVTRSYDKALLALLTHPLGGGAEKAPKVLDALNKVHHLGLT